MMAFDFKKKYKTLYAPTAKPSIVDVPKMTFVMVNVRTQPLSTLTLLRYYTVFPIP
jgi:hypothetical protein